MCRILPTNVLLTTETDRGLMFGLVICFLDPLLANRVPRLVPLKDEYTSWNTPTVVGFVDFFVFTVFRRCLVEVFGVSVVLALRLESAVGQRLTTDE